MTKSGLHWTRGKDRARSGLQRQRGRLQRRRGRRHRLRIGNSILTEMCDYFRCAPPPPPGARRGRLSPHVPSQIQSARSPTSGGVGWVTATWNLCNYGAYGLSGCSRTRERRSEATGITWHNILWPPQENLVQQPAYINRFHIQYSGA